MQFCAPFKGAYLTFLFNQRLMLFCDQSSKKQNNTKQNKTKQYIGVYHWKCIFYRLIAFPAPQTLLTFTNGLDECVGRLQRRLHSNIALTPTHLCISAINWTSAHISRSYHLRLLFFKARILTSNALNLLHRNRRKIRVTAIFARTRYRTRRT